jgi:hypothetical protein
MGKTQSKAICGGCGGNRKCGGKLKFLAAAESGDPDVLSIDRTVNVDPPQLETVQPNDDALASQMLDKELSRVPHMLQDQYFSTKWFSEAFHEQEQQLSMYRQRGQASHVNSSKQSAALFMRYNSPSSLLEAIQETVEHLEPDSTQSSMNASATEKLRKFDELHKGSSADTILMKGSRLVEYYRERTREKRGWQPLPKRQDLELSETRYASYGARTCTWHPSDLADKIQSHGTGTKSFWSAQAPYSSDKSYLEVQKYHTNVPIVSLSHCWQTREHPDPDGHTLACFGSYANLLLSTLMRGKDHCLHEGDFAFFMDWCCLHQRPRTPEQNIRFSRALKNVNWGVPRGW